MHLMPHSLKLSPLILKQSNLNTTISSYLEADFCREDIVYLDFYSLDSAKNLSISMRTAYALGLAPTYVFCSFMDPV